MARTNDAYSWSSEPLAQVSRISCELRKASLNAKSSPSLYVLASDLIDLSCVESTSRHFGVCMTAEYVSALMLWSRIAL